MSKFIHIYKDGDKDQRVSINIEHIIYVHMTDDQELPIIIKTTDGTVFKSNFLHMTDTEKEELKSINYPGLGNYPH